MSRKDVGRALDVKGKIMMNAPFTQDLFIKAWNFASEAHSAQKLPGKNIPYINHIGNVAMEIITAITALPVECPDLAVQCALLHDVIEDTDVSYDQVEAVFGNDVADGVLSLSKDKALPTKQRQMEDSLNRIKRQPKEVWMVKLADRITNLQPPPHYWDTDKMIQYRDEAILIHRHLGESHGVLSDRLKGKIDGYQRFIS